MLVIFNVGYVSITFCNVVACWLFLKNVSKIEVYQHFSQSNVCAGNSAYDFAKEIFIFWFC